MGQVWEEAHSKMSGGRNRCGGQASCEHAAVREAGGSDTCAEPGCLAACRHHLVNARVRQVKGEQDGSQSSHFKF